MQKISKRLFVIPLLLLIVVQRRRSFGAQGGVPDLKRGSARRRDSSMSNLRFREAITTIPPYTPAKSLAEIKRQFGIERIVRLAANEITMGFSPRVQAAIAAALPDIYLYPDGASSQLRLKLAELLQIKARLSFIRRLAPWVWNISRRRPILSW